MANSGEPQTAVNLTKWLSDVRAVLLLAGLVLYVVLRVAYARFYAPFGLSPDDLGLGYVDLLAQAAVATVVVVVLVVGSAASTIALYEHRRWYDVALVVLIFVLMGFSVVLSEFRVLPVAVAVVSIALVARGMTRVGGMEDRARRAWLTPVVSFFVLAAAWLLVDAANRDAAAVRAGSPMPSYIMGVPVGLWKAEAATLSWTTNRIDPGVRGLAKSCVVYLGQSGNTLFLYAPYAGRRATFRVPAGAAVVRVVPGGSCVPGTGKPVPSRRDQLEFEDAP